MPFPGLSAVATTRHISRPGGCSGCPATPPETISVTCNPGVNASQGGPDPGKAAKPVEWPGPPNALRDCEQRNVSTINGSVGYEQAHFRERVFFTDARLLPDPTFLQWHQVKMISAEQRSEPVRKCGTEPAMAIKENPASFVLCICNFCIHRNMWVKIFRTISKASTHGRRVS